jgi:hypothetical protein
VSQLPDSPLNIRLLKCHLPYFLNIPLLCFLTSLLWVLNFRSCAFLKCCLLDNPNICLFRFPQMSFIMCPEFSFIIRFLSSILVLRISMYCTQPELSSTLFSKFVFIIRFLNGVYFNLYISWIFIRTYWIFLNSCLLFVTILLFHEMFIKYLLNCHLICS